MTHPGYPDTDMLRREADAHKRDADDIDIMVTLAEALRAAYVIVRRLPELRHPNTVISIEEIVQELSDAITDVEREAHRIANEPVVLEP